MQATTAHSWRCSLKGAMEDEFRATDDVFLRITVFDWVYKLLLITSRWKKSGGKDWYRIASQYFVWQCRINKWTAAINVLWGKQEKQIQVFTAVTLDVLFPTVIWSDLFLSNTVNRCWQLLYVKVYYFNIYWQNTKKGNKMVLWLKYCSLFLHLIYSQSGVK